DRIPDEVRDVPIVIRDGNPPWNGAAVANYADLPRKTLLSIDRDTLDYASTLNGAPVHAASEFWCEAGPPASPGLPVSQRPIPFVAAFTGRPPDALRRDRLWLAQQPPALRDLVAATIAAARASYREPISAIAFGLARTAGIELDLHGPEIRRAIEFATIVLTSEERLELANAARRVPGVIVTNLPAAMVPAHPQTRFLPPMAFPDLLRLFGEARCVLSHLPHRMTGALSERFHNAGVRGTFTILPRSNAALRDAALAPLLLGFDPGAEAVPEHLARVVDRSRELDGMQDALERTTRERFSPDRAILEMLAHAPD
ncbi:MAG: hypothetical protein AB7O45_13205, partial [Alphaproteobacteria bacterium]